MKQTLTFSGINCVKQYRLTGRVFDAGCVHFHNRKFVNLAVRPRVCGH